MSLLFRGNIRKEKSYQKTIIPRRGARGGGEGQLVGGFQSYFNPISFAGRTIVCKFKARRGKEDEGEGRGEGEGEVGGGIINKKHTNPDIYLNTPANIINILTLLTVHPPHSSLLYSISSTLNRVVSRNIIFIYFFLYYGL